MADAKRIVRIDYKAYFADADRLYDTTNADAAKEAGIFNEKVTYAPMAYIIGSGSLYADLDAAIAGAEIGKETEVSPARRPPVPGTPGSSSSTPSRSSTRTRSTPTPACPSASATATVSSCPSEPAVSRSTSTTPWPDTT